MAVSWKQLVSVLVRSLLGGSQPTPGTFRRGVILHNAALGLWCRYTPEGALDTCHHSYHHLLHTSPYPV
jgi:hypothetical protein